MQILRAVAAPMLFLGIAIYGLWLSVFQPFHNWDMIAYIAAAKAFEDDDSARLHAFTYRSLRASVSEAEYQVLAPSQGEGYRQAVSRDPSAFAEQLPFYQIRPVYVGLVYLLYKLGLNIGCVTHFISGLSVFAGIVLLYPLSKSVLAKKFVYVIPPLAIAFGALDLGRFSTPDGLAFLAVVISAFLFLKSRIPLLLVFLPIMVGIRTDLALFTAPMYFAIFLFFKTRRWTTAFSALTSLGVYWGIVTYWSNPGWATLFYFTFIDTLAHPVSMPPVLELHDYLNGFVLGARELIYNRGFVLYLVVAGYSAYLIKAWAQTTSIHTTLTSPSCALAVVCLVFVVSHFIAFPLSSERYFSASYLIGAFSLLAMLSGGLGQMNPSQQQAAPDRRTSLSNAGN